LTETFAQLIRDNGGEVKKTEQWGLKTLAFRMNKNRKGHYVLFNLEAPHAAVAEMERNMRLNEDVLRYLTVRVEEHEEGPSAMMQRRDDRERGERGFDRDRGYRPRREDGAPEAEVIEGVVA
jgi:small subunit ribosomal protein S6